MKFLIPLFLAFAAGYAAYKWLYPPFAQILEFTEPAPRHEKEELVVVVPETKPEMIVAPAPMAEVRPESMVELKPEPMPEMPKSPEPKSDSKPKMAKAPEPLPKDPNAFVTPVFPPAEELTRNWTAVPKGFFNTPKELTVNRDLEIRMQVGKASASTTFKAGSKIFVMGQRGPSLIVGTAADSSMRGEVMMDDTNFKEVFATAYEQVKVMRAMEARRAHEYRLSVAEREKSSPSPASKGGGDGKPSRDADGSYPVLLASMRSGEVTEVKPENVKAWSDPSRETINGSEYWVVNVTFETQTMFGRFDTEVQARIKNGHVEKWVYAGSGEVVP